VRRPREHNPERVESQALTKEVQPSPRVVILSLLGNGEVEAAVEEGGVGVAELDGAVAVGGKCLGKKVLGLI
jgi:hypothetical protein